MTTALARALATFAATLLVASLVVFLVLNVLPGDPAAIVLGMGAQPETLAALRAQMGLDRPAPERYLVWIAGLAMGDLGYSHTYAIPVSELVGQRIVVSAPLALMAILLSTAIAIPAGVYAAARRGRLADLVVSLGAQVGVAIPNFWFAILMIFLFALTLGWLPAGGFPGWEQGLWPGSRALILPAVALALPQAAILSRVTRSAMLETLGEDHVRTARAKGLGEAAVLIRHALRNALIPVVTILGLQLSFLLAGTIVIEQACNLPGLGRLLFQAIAQRDLVTVQSVVMLLVAVVVFVNFLVDLLYVAIDPRLRNVGHGA
jgi:peptide/nickel transport system permease protein